MPDDHPSINSCLCDEERSLYEQLPDFHREYIYSLCKESVSHDDFHANILNAGYWSVRESIGWSSRLSNVCRLVFPFQFLADAEEHFSREMYWEFHPDPVKKFARLLGMPNIPVSEFWARQEQEQEQEQEQRDIDAFLMTIISLARFDAQCLEGLNSTVRGAILVWRDYVGLSKQQLVREKQTKSEPKREINKRHQAWYDRYKELKAADIYGKKDNSFYQDIANEWLVDVSVVRKAVERQKKF